MSAYAPLITGVVIALIGLLSGVWAVGKNRAEASEKLVNTAMVIVKETKTSLTECEEDRQTLEQRLATSDQRVMQAEQAALVAAAKAEQLQATVDELLRRFDELEAERIQLREDIAALEEQIKGLGHKPRRKTKKEEQSDDSHTGTS